MSQTSTGVLSEVLDKFEVDLLTDWIQEQRDGHVSLAKATEQRAQCAGFLARLCDAVRSGNLSDLDAPEWSRMRELLAGISRSAVEQGIAPSGVVFFVLSLKKPLVARLRQVLAEEPQRLLDETWTATALLDKLGLFTTEVAQKAREEIILRQQAELLELSTPVVKLWEGILALPMIGTLDSARAQVVMDSLLQKIAETGSEIAIIDITGVPTVDTQVAHHLLKTVAAARLMGADCMISGIRPPIAQTIVHLGVDLTSVITKATLADAFVLALQRIGTTIVTAPARS